MGQREILLKLSLQFKKHKLLYLLTGSFAVSYYGMPRATHDIDFIVEVSKRNANKVKKIVQELAAEFIYSKNNLTEVFSKPSLYNLVHETTGIKVDFWIVKGSEFQKKYIRRQEFMLDKYNITVISPEDLILTKLSWIKQIFSERHFMDCVGIWRVQKDKLDKEYLYSNARQLKVAKLLKEVLQH